MLNLKRMIKLVALLGLSMVASSVYALTPGNTTLTNNAKLTYTGNTDGIFAAVTVTVDTIAALPAGFDLLNVNKAESQSFSALFTITATNNGPDDYGIVPTFTATNATGTAAFGFFPNADGTGTEITSVNLGATAFQEATAGTTIRVPLDGTNNGIVNGLEVTDKVDINDITYTIVSVDDTTNATYAVIVLNNAIPASLPVGTAIQEVRDVFLFTSTVGTHTVPGTADLAVVITATPTLNGALAASIDTFTINIVRVTVKKYVRNTTSDNFVGCGPGVTVMSFTNNYYEATVSGCVVKANSDDELEYLIRVVTPNDAGAELADAVIGDVLPPFTAFVPGSTKLNNAGVDDGNDTTAPVFPLDPVTGFADNNGGMLIQDAAALPAPASGAQGDGNVAINSTVDVVYRVTLQ